MRGNRHMEAFIDVNLVVFFVMAEKSLREEVMELRQLVAEQHKANELQEEHITELRDGVRELLMICKGDPSINYEGIIQTQIRMDRKLTAVFDWQVEAQRYINVIKSKTLWKIVLWLGIILASGILTMRYGVDFLYNLFKAWAK